MNQFVVPADATAGELSAHVERVLSGTTIERVESGTWHVSYAVPVTLRQLLAAGICFDGSMPLLGLTVRDLQDRAGLFRLVFAVDAGCGHFAEAPVRLGCVEAYLTSLDETEEGEYTDLPLAAGPASSETDRRMPRAVERALDALEPRWRIVQDLEALRLRRQFEEQP